MQEIRALFMAQALVVSARVAIAAVWKGETAIDFIRSALRLKLGGNIIRFRDLPLPLAVIATDILAHTVDSVSAHPRKSLVVHSTESTPDMEVAEAVRRSMSGSC